MIKRAFEDILRDVEQAREINHHGLREKQNLFGS